jgi:hypothetical protein
MSVETKFVHICDNAFVAPDGKLSMMGVFDIIRAIELPQTHPELFVVVSIAGPAGEHDGKIIVESLSGGKKLFSAEGKFEINNELREGVIMARIKDIKLEEEGDYNLKILIDKKPVYCEKSLKVEKI